MVSDTYSSHILFVHAFYAQYLLFASLFIVYVFSQDPPTNVRPLKGVNVAAAFLFRFVS